MTTDPTSEDKAIAHLEQQAAEQNAEYQAKREHQRDELEKRIEKVRQVFLDGSVIAASMANMPRPRLTVRARLRLIRRALTP